jgi:EmrB/QacA subfamily drug resistance transporter
MEATPTIEEEPSHDLCQEASGFSKGLVLLGIGLGTFMFSLDVNIVNLSLPILMRSLHTNLATIEWVVLSYLLMITVFVIGAGRLGDMYNKKWLYLGGLIVFTLSSLLCAIAPTVGFLIGFRVLQGLGAVFIAALGTAIVTQLFPQQERGRVLGIIDGIFGMGMGLGPTVGGLLIGLGGWRLVFWVNVPIGLIASLIVALFVPSSAGSKAKHSFDVMGALLMIVTLTCLALALTEIQRQGFGELIQLVLLAIAAIGLVGFLAVEARQKEPMLDLKIFHSLQLSFSIFVMWKVQVVVASVLFLLPLFLLLVKQYPTQQAGLLMGTHSIILGLIAPLGGILSDRFGSHLIRIIGLFLLALGCLAISTFDGNLTWLGYVVRIAPYGLGLGMFRPSNNSAALETAPPERLGVASSLLYFSRILGQTMGLSLMGTVFSLMTMISAGLPVNADVTNSPIEALVFGFQTSSRILVLILITAAILAAGLWGLEQRRAQTASATGG